MDQAECYGFYVYFAVFAAALAAFAWQQKPVPVDKRSMHVDMPAAAGSRLSPTPTRATTAACSNLSTKPKPKPMPKRWRRKPEPASRRKQVRKGGIPDLLLE